MKRANDWIVRFNGLRLFYLRLLQLCFYFQASSLTALSIEPSQHVLDGITSLSLVAFPVYLFGTSCALRRHLSGEVTSEVKMRFCNDCIWCLGSFCVVARDIFPAFVGDLLPYLTPLLYGVDITLSSVRLHAANLMFAIANGSGRLGSIERARTSARHGEDLPRAVQARAVKGLRKDLLLGLGSVLLTVGYTASMPLAALGAGVMFSTDVFFRCSLDHEVQRPERGFRFLASGLAARASRATAVVWRSGARMIEEQGFPVSGRIPLVAVV